MLVLVMFFIAGMRADGAEEVAVLHMPSITKIKSGAKDGDEDCGEEIKPVLFAIDEGYQPVDGGYGGQDGKQKPDIAFCPITQIHIFRISID